MIGLRNPSVFLSLLIAVAVTVSSADDDYDYSEEDKKPSCDPAICRLPDCRCFGSQPDIPLDQRPQFVMVTFDDAMTVANVETYKQIVRKSRFQKDVKITFFVCHEYNDYSITQSFYSQGHEIAVHTISHGEKPGLWRSAKKDGSENSGHRRYDPLAFPKEELGGHRAPFLQTAVKTVTLNYRLQDCQIEPCPNGRFEGLWEVPMVQYHRSSKEGDFYCSMLDACTPQPKTASDTKDYLMKNFLRHYRSNKAPFLHASALKHTVEKERLDGFMQFLDEILQKPDVFAATVRDVVECRLSPCDSYDRSGSVRPRASIPKKDRYVLLLQESLRTREAARSLPEFLSLVKKHLLARYHQDFQTDYCNFLIYKDTLESLKFLFRRF
ncbi:nodB homology domain-containing protein [Trichonephila inaurata madagascariensis]|uniref:NodB homology domain-containing protein n=1 Tax=Trichonephila inaurata madagascariensis TaxID=2747483 RepID=A0A8X7BPC9_9ARAC|nr:nodB homology domain-containing protein [Trichonephila inaurata madagascariensis]